MMKKNLSKFIALLLTLTLVLTSALAVFAEGEAPVTAGDGTAQTSVEATTPDAYTGVLSTGDDQTSGTGESGRGNRTGRG